MCIIHSGIAYAIHIGIFNNNVHLSCAHQRTGQSNRANDNGQPDAEVSFSLNGLNERGILLSLWTSKMIQSSQISVRTKSVSARSPHDRFGGIVEL